MSKVSEAITITPRTHIAVAGRRMLANQLAIVQRHRPDLERDTSATAVHKTRKALRRSFTAFKTFAAYDQPKSFKYYRRRLKKIMRRLGRCRDLTILRHNYDRYRETAAIDPAAADHLDHYWAEQLVAAKVTLRAYLARPKTTSLIDDYATFLNEPFEPAAARPFTPVQVRHAAPLLIHQRLATVLAFDDHLAHANYARLHQLRIQFKELRYTLEFFAPLLDGRVSPLLDHLNDIQDHLGDLNDAHVALQLLQKTPGRETAVAAYQAHCRETAVQLEATFPGLWTDFNDPAWRQQLMTAVMAL